MPYVQTFDRTQMMMCSWDSFVDPESIARLIDAFVDSLDLKKYHVKEVAKEGRPSYDPRGMYKLYIYGSRKGIRSSRISKNGVTDGGSIAPIFRMCEFYSVFNDT